tara:strand:+ start:1009 stop:1170 length:162 start_codon:yes stop_codon:yes gene_type:complete
LLDNYEVADCGKFPRIKDVVLNDLENAKLRSGKTRKPRSRLSKLRLLMHDALR